MTNRILVIEDNPASLQLMSYLLQASGQTVLTATDGRAGLEIAQRERPDLIVCDLQMPVMDGYEVARQVRDDPALCHLPLVAVTAYAMVDDRARVLAAGFNGYIAKPIEPETIASQVLAFLPSDDRPTQPHVELAETIPSSPLRWSAESTAKILVVDDCRANLEFVTSALAPFGYDVVCAASAQDGLTCIRETTPDLVLCDVHMPDIDGLGVLHVLKGDPRLRSIPVVMITSCLWEQREREEALALGAVKWLVRPLTPQQLIAELKDALESRSWAPS